MSIVSVTELWDSRSGQQNWKAQVQYTRKFKVYCSDKTDHTTAILASGLIPARLAPHPTNPYALVENRKVTNTTDDPNVYTVDVSYNSQFDFDPATTNDDPLSRPAIYSFSFERGNKAVRYDINNDPIDNSADTPIEPPLELENSLPIISITINKASFSFAQISTLQDCVNSDVWNGFAIHTVKVRGIEVNKMWENNVLYWQYKWTLAVKWDKWRPVKVLDQGYYELDASGDPISIRDKFGNPLPAPSLLDGSGGKKDPSDPAVYLDFDMNREVAFNSVPIP